MKNINNPFDLIKEPRKHGFYINGYNAGLSGWIYTYSDRKNVVRTSWSQGYLDAVNYRKMVILLSGGITNYYEYHMDVDVGS